MKKLEMKAYKISQIDFYNNLANGTKLELSNKYSYNVKYSQNGICEGILKVDISDKGGNPDFRISVTVQGIFSFDGEESREKIHVESFRELFPYARVIVCNLTTTAGMPPIMIPPIDMESQEIFRIDMPNLGKNNNQE